MIFSMGQLGRLNSLVPANYPLPFHWLSFHCPILSRVCVLFVCSSAWAWMPKWRTYLLGWLEAKIGTKVEVPLGLFGRKLAHWAFL